MKKFTFQIFAILAFAFTWQANAQFTESFETEIPAAWTVINGGDSNAWVQSSSPSGGAQDGAGVASIAYSSTAHNDYLITPSIVVTANTNDRLSFYVKSRSSSFLESYEVLLSTTDALEASFSTVLQASSEAPSAWTQLTFSLSAYVGQTIYVALRATGTDEFNLYADNFVNDAAPACTPTVVDSSTVVDDCGSSLFSVDVVVSTVGDGSVITDGLGGSFPIIAGTVTVGPYATGTTVTLDVVHTDGACDFSLGDFSFDSCPDIVVCATPVNVTYCYTANDTTEFVYQSSDGSNLKVTFNAGEVENSWDELIVLDSDGTTELYNGYGASGDLTGLEFTASGDSITVKIQSDGTGSCSTDSYTSWDFDVICLSCTPAEATAVVVEDCGTETYEIDVDVTTVGDATAISDGINTFAISGTGIITVNGTGSGYAFATPVTLSLVHSDAACDYDLGTYNFIACPPANDDCTNAIGLTVNTDFACGTVTSGTVLGATDSAVSGSTCFGTDDDDVWYSFVASATSHRVSLTNISGSASDMYHVTYAAAPGCGSLGAAIQCSDSNTSNPTGLTIGETYYVQVYTYTSTPGQDTTFDICIGTPPPPPVNVDCANATPIACGETINATSFGSTGNQEGSGCSIGNNGIWFTFTGTGGDMTLVSTASFDHEVALSSGSCGALVNVNCDDQSSGAESHTFTSVLNETYYVYIAHYSSGNTSTGTISITLTCAVIPTCTQAVVDSSTVVETCNPDGTGTFVVNHVVSNAGDAGTVLDDGTNTYPVIVGTITTGPYNSGDSVTIDLVGVDSDCDFTVGTYTFICPQPAPANDDIMNPVKIEMGSAVCEDPIIGTNVSATDSVENGASCGTPEGDVWFQIEIPNTGEVTVETSSSGGISDTVMAIYSGVPGSLVEVACDDDGGTGSFSSIALTGQTPGDIYYVRVWEYQNNAFGTFSICAWSPTTLSVDTNVIEGFSYYPNPVNNVLNVKAQTNISNVAVYNMLGQEVLRTAPNTFASEVDMSNLQTGAYFVKVTIGNATQTIRVIKN